MYVEKNYKKAKKYYLKAIKLGNSEAMCSMGYYYQLIKKDYKLMIQYYTMAIELFHCGAMCNLGYYYVIEKDHETGKDVEKRKRIYSSELVEEIISLEKIRDKKNNKHKIAVRNLVLEFLEETGHYISGEVQFCWYQLQKLRQWHQYFFLVKQLSFPKNGKLLKVANYEPIQGFVSVDEDIKASKAISYSSALKYYKEADGDQYGEEEENSNKEKNPDCLFPPHQSALKAAGYYRSIEDGRFAYLYMQGYTFNPNMYW